MDMSGDLHGAGVCVVRAEIQGDHVLISVTTSSGAHRSRVESVRHFVDPDQALATVSEFLRAFTDSIDPPGDRYGGDHG
jgi:hypothetical protein